MHAYLKRFFVSLAVTAMLALGFIAYLRPEFVVAVANRLVLCF